MLNISKPRETAESLTLEGKTLLNSAQPDAALTAFDKALGLDPAYASAWYYKGNTLFGCGQFAEALNCYEQACMQDPAMTNAWSNRGFTLVRLERATEALTCYHRVCDLTPDDINAWADYGLALLNLKRFAEAVASYNKALVLAPNNPDILFNKATALSELKQYEAALALYEDILLIDENYDKAWFKRGSLLLHFKRYEEAQKSYRKALDLKPDNAQAWAEYGNAISALGRHKDALDCYNKALAMGYELPDLWSNKGTSLFFLDQYEEALECQNKALSLLPTSAFIWANKGVILSYTGQHNKAVECYQKAHECDPSNYDNIFLQGLLFLLLGKYHQGWALHEHRWQAKNSASEKQIRHQYIPPLTDQNNIAGKRILVWYEQGFGDTILFSRYIPMLEKLGAHVTFEVQAPLKNLLSDFLPHTKIVNTHKPSIEDFDYQIPIASLPYLFQTDENSIPPPIQNMSASTEKINLWSRSIVHSGKMNIGIVCSGNAEHKNDINRSIALEKFLPLCEAANLYLIQKDLRNTDREILENSDIFFLGEDIQDFEDMAAIMSHLDLIISIDSAPAHLAGTMGIPIWLLLPFSPDWRWLLDREDSPWYPSMRLFRQPKLQDWDSVMVNVLNALKDFQK